MKPLTAEWVAKAEGDFATLEREAEVRTNPNYDAICFHAQQCAEKYLKGMLYEEDISFPKTHYLLGLLNLLLPAKPDFRSFREDMALLSGFAVDFRYPGELASDDSALDARRRCRSFRSEARKALGLDEQE
jgi:HEPN domain-containing protein